MLFVRVRELLILAGMLVVFIAFWALVIAWFSGYFS